MDSRGSEGFGLEQRFPARGFGDACCLVGHFDAGKACDSLGQGSSP